MSYLVTKQKLALDDISGKFIYQKTLIPTLEAKYFNGERQGMMALLSVENGTRVGGMLSIHRDSGSNCQKMKPKEVC